MKPSQNAKAKQPPELLRSFWNWVLLDALRRKNFRWADLVQGT
jgi:hypothetical protein